MTDYAALKAADAALPDAPLPVDEAAAALNAQTRAVTIDIASRDAREVLLVSGEWGGVVILSNSAPSTSLPAQIVGAAIVLRDTLTLTETLHTSDDAVVAKVGTLLGALGSQGAGVLSDTTISTLLGMRNVTRPVWQPAVTAGDIQTARAQP
ncbi:MAG: hypothetical protein JWP29_3548 [Rhodoferax sp.]|nr:hypothetical protein [Rhodoferax sp.]